MAHKITISSRPHVNQDGRESKTKKDWFFRDKSRGKVFVSQPFTSEKAVKEAIEKYRDELVRRHRTAHPNDKRGMKQFSTSIAPKPQKREGNLGDRYLMRIGRFFG